METGTEEKAALDWYCLRVISQREDMVAKFLRYYGLKTEIKTERRFGKWNPKKKQRTDKFYCAASGYVFIGLPAGDADPWRFVRTSHLIRSVVSREGRPARLDVQKLIRFLGYPSSAADVPDKRFCGQCGRLCQPLINDNVGFGPCVEDAESPLECYSLRKQVTSSYVLAQQLGRDVHPDTVALTKRLGIPDSLVRQWVDKELRASAIREELARARYDDSSLLCQVAKWVRKGDADERIIALIDELRGALDPTEGGTLEMTFGQIADWHQHVATRASDLLSDPGDWEFDQ